MSLTELPAGEANTSKSIVQVVDDGNGCGFKQMETDLGTVFLLATIAPKECSSRVPAFLCSYFYRMCGNDKATSHWPTRDECLDMKNVYCRSEWTVVGNYLEDSDHCLRLPDCDLLPAGANTVKYRNVYIPSYHRDIHRKPSNYGCVTF